jgi:site-specific DNA-methyltransferase (adenine-specific)
VVAENVQGELTGMLEITCEDCMDLMARYPDKYFDLAIVDPPYGGGNHHQGNKQIKGTKGCSYGPKRKTVQWDIAPKQQYFDELFRVSDKQIIFGGNYFRLPPMRNFIIYYKTNIPEGFNMAACEYAWTNIAGNAAIFKHHPRPDDDRFHPTQKPVALYKWLLSRYAKPGWKILDTHFGSGSSGIACHDLGFDLTASEIDRDYYAAAMERIREYQRQQTFNFTEAAPKC